MKKLLFMLFLGFSIQTAQAQTVQDFKVKNASNEKDRTMMLDILRADLYKMVKQELIFVVNHFKVSGNYAWFEGNAQRKDGKEIRFPADDDMPHDCCLATALFKKSNGKWYIVESGAFGTDVWYMGTAGRYPYVPKVIFTPLARRNY